MLKGIYQLQIGINANNPVLENFVIHTSKRINTQIFPYQICLCGLDLRGQYT